jgi:Cu-processing system permease protein
MPTLLLSHIWTIAKNTYKEIIRDRLLYGIFLIGMLLTASSFFAGSVSLDQSDRVTANIAVAAIHLFSFFICVFVATNSMNKDFERRALYLLFPKPISRSSYVLGKYLGVVLLLITSLVILGGFFAIGSLFVSHALLSGLAVNLTYSFLEISFLIALAILFASFTAPLNAALYTIALFIIGHSMGTIKSIMDKQGTALSQHLITFCYYVLPNLEKFDIRRAVLYNMYPPASAVVWTLEYWLLYTAIILFLAILVMRNKEV